MTVIYQSPKNAYNRAMEFLLWFCMFLLTCGFGATVMLLIFLLNHKIKIH